MLERNIFKWQYYNNFVGIGCESMNMFIRILSIFIIFVFFAPSNANAKYYAKPTMTNIIKTMMRYGAINIYDDDIIDAYERTSDCPTYAKNYADDFKWEEVRNKVRKDIIENVQFFPVAFKYETTMVLDRYDFKNKIYPFYFTGGRKRTNTFIVNASNKDGCEAMRKEIIPLKYKFVLRNTIKLDGLHLTQKQGKDLFERMELSGNKGHMVYPRFNMRVKYIATLVSKSDLSKAVEAAKFVSNNVMQISIMQSRDAGEATIDTELDSIEYYEDEGRTKLIYTYRP